MTRLELAVAIISILFGILLAIFTYVILFTLSAGPVAAGVF